MKIVIVGGVAAGASCAARISRLEKNAEIVMLEKSSHVSYANCGLPYYVGNVIKDEGALTVQTKEQFKAKFNIDARPNSEVVKIDRANKLVVVKNVITNEEYTESYDKLVLATGAKPIVPNLEGVDSSKIFTLRNVKDAHDMHAFVNNNKPKSAVVIGGGFIGLEVMENLAGLGIKVTLIEGADQILAPVDYDMSQILNNEIRNNNVDLVLNEMVAGFEENDGILVKTNKNAYQADMAVLAIGVIPDTKLAAECGLELGVKNSVVVNEHMLTSDENIYAGGDAVCIYNAVSKQNELVSLAGPANKQGRIIADNICGKATKYHGAVPTSIIKLFSYTAASTGLNEKKAKALGINYDTVITTPNTNASYYPGYSQLIVKVIYEKETKRILGGQVIGKKHVDKPIDTLATIIYKNGTADDLINLDLAYAPAYSSAKNPLNMVGYIIENVEAGLVKQWQYKTEEDVTYLDIREKAMFDAGHLEGAINIPLGKLRESLDQLDKSKKVYLNCLSGLNSYFASRILTQNGFDCYNLKGGYNFYLLTQPVQKEIAKVEKLEVSKTTTQADEIKRVKGLGFLQVRGTDYFNGRIITRNGKITTKELQTISEAANLYGNGEVAMTTRLTIEVQGIHFDNIDKFIAHVNEGGLLTGGTGSKVRPIVACKGTTCQYGLIDTYGLSEKIHERFYIDYHGVSLPHKFKIAVGGCPNNCVKPNLNDLGIIGARVPVVELDKCRGCKKCGVVNNCPIKSANVVDGKVVLGEECNSCGRCVGKCPFGVIEGYQTGYKVYVGGRWGKKFNHGVPLTKIFTSEEEVLEIVDKAILLYRSEGISGERFADTITRLGFEYVNAKLLSNELLERKEEILGITVVGGATC